MSIHGGCSAKVVGVGFGAIAVVGAVLAFATMRTVDAGSVAVFQYKPYLIGKGGVSDNVLVGPDRAYMWPSTSMWEVSIAPATLPVHVEDFMSSDRIPLDFDVAITIKVTNPEDAPKLIRKFGTGPQTTFKTLVLQDSETSRQVKRTSGELMSFLRDQIRHHHSAEFIAAQKPDGTVSDAASVVERNTREHINAFLVKAGAGMIQVENIALGRANPPEGVRKSIEATAEQAQDVKTQFERQKAQTARRDAEIASAAADRAYQDELKLSPEAWLRIKELETYNKVCKDGNCTFVMGNQASVMVSRK